MEFWLHARARRRNGLYYDGTTVAPLWRDISFQTDTSCEILTTTDFSLVCKITKKGHATGKRNSSML
jgi:hypothetical protein